MLTRAFIKSAGLLCTEDAVGVEQLRLDPGVPARIRRFTKVVRSVLLGDSSTRGIQAASLVALDGVPPSALKQVQSGLDNIYVWRDLRCVEWKATEPPRLERRALHARTLLLLDATRSDSDPGDAPVNFALDLANYLDQHPAYAAFKPRERVREFERDALCWWYQCLPLPLFFHLSGLQPLSAVSRACLASEQTLLVPELTTAADGSDDAPFSVDESCSELLDVMSLSTGPDSSSIVLRQALDHVSLLGGETDAPAKRRWIGALLGLRLLAARAGPLTALLLAWAIDLIESGTVRQPNPPKGTPHAYLHKALLPLFEGLKALSGDVGEWELTSLDQLYRAMVAAESVGSQRTMASALTNFHHFLEDWLDVPSLKASLHGEVPLAEVRAMVIWPHQIGLALQWVDRATDDPRLAGAVRVALLIARESPSRASELAFLRLANVTDWSTYLEIEVAPSMRYGRLKSRAAQRRLYFRDPEGMAVVRDWVRAREAANLGPSTLLFGDPLNPDAVYRRAAMSRVIGALLKSATGDPRVVGHSLRHTVVSARNEFVILTSSIGDINRFGETAVDAGHVTAATGFVSYTHLYERALRQWLDAAHAALVKLTSDEVGRVAGMTASALRQRACRSSSDTALTGWNLIREAASGLCFPLAREGFNWVQPVPPVMAARVDADFGPAVTLMLLQRLAEGHVPSEVAASFMLEPHSVERLSTIAMATLAATGAAIWVRRLGVRIEAPVDVAEAFDRMDVDLSEAAQGKFETLQLWLQQSRPAELLQAAVESWTACRKGKYLGLDVPLAPLGLYRLIAAAGVNPVLLRVCLRGESLDTVGLVLLQNTERDFVTAFGVKPRVHLVEPRSRVAQAYLQFDSEDTKNQPYGSSGSLKGLDVLMLAVAVHLKWQQ